MNDAFDKIRLSADGTRKSQKWYQSQINQLTGSGNFSVEELMRNRKQLTKTIIPGGMYLFYYDPKHKSTLPMYDTLPLVLPFRQVPDGFFGINLHYLPYMLRFRTLGHLSKLANTDKITEDTRINLSWQIISSVSTLAPAKDAVKHYLTAHVKSSFLKINYADWITASQLPLERFVYNNNTRRK